MCECDRLHVDALGLQGKILAQLAEAGLAVFERRNGGPPLAPGVRYLIMLLAAGSGSGLPSGMVGVAGDHPGNRMGTLGAARLLDVSERHVRRLAASGQIRGVKCGRHWLFDGEDLRRQRAA